jgi:hypothetical protein
LSKLISNAVSSPMVSPPMFDRERLLIGKYDHQFMA